MLRSYLTIALRTLKNQKGYAFVNISGLAIGLAACVIIFLYISNERSYDTFHERADRIYQTGIQGVIGGQFLEEASTATPMGPAMLADFPEIEQFVRVKPMNRTLLAREETRFYEENVFWADSSFFEVFSIALNQGDPSSVLKEPGTIVISESVARKYFGDASPIGQVLEANNTDSWTITGVMEDTPVNSHVRFDVLVSMESVLSDLPPNWLSHHLYTYVLLREGTDPEAFSAKLPGMVDTYAAPEFERFTGTSFAEAQAAGLEFRYYMQPLTEMYLNHIGNSPIGITSDGRYLYILAAIALFILLLACINFMNLSTARSAQRAREVGLRKVLGSDRQQLIRQFLGESILLSCFALVFAAILVAVTLPMFNALAGRPLAITLPGMFMIACMLIGITLVSGLLAGIYPAFVLSAFQPARVLKGRFTGGSGKSWLRSSLVVVQFTVSIFLLIGTGVVFNQLQFMQNMRLGFDGEQVVVLPIESADARDSFDTFRNTLLQHPQIASVAASDFIPGRANSSNAYRPEGVPPTETYVMYTARVSHEYLQTLDIELLHGRTFDRDRPTDITDAIIINESGARELGWDRPEEALGKRIAEIAAGDNDEDIYRTVIGVVKDFHFQSLHSKILPLAMNIDPGNFVRATVRILPDNMPETMNFIQQEWEAYESGFPYSAVFVDDDFNRYYAQEQRLSRIFIVFTALAIFIACMGLFGMASFIAQRRTKEIGVRKVLGASVSGLVVMLSSEFTWLVVISALLAMPVAYLAMSQWLESFAYQVGVSWWLFAASGLAALLVAWLTVSYQSIKAALTNPIDTLKYE